AGRPGPGAGDVAPRDRRVRGLGTAGGAALRRRGRGAPPAPRFVPGHAGCKTAAEPRGARRAHPGIRIRPGKGPRPDRGPAHRAGRARALRGARTRRGRVPAPLRTAAPDRPDRRARPLHQGRALPIRRAMPGLNHRGADACTWSRRAVPMDVEDIAHTIKRLVRSHVPVAPRDPRFGPTARLFDDGYVDSMGVAELIAFIEDAFGVAVPDEALMSDEFATIAGMARVVAGLRGASAARERVAAGGEP